MVSASSFCTRAASSGSVARTFSYVAANAFQSRAVCPVSLGSVASGRLSPRRWSSSVKRLNADASISRESATGPAYALARMHSYACRSVSTVVGVSTGGSPGGAVGSMVCRTHAGTAEAACALVPNGSAYNTTPAPTATASPAAAIRGPGARCRPPLRSRRMIPKVLLTNCSLSRRPGRCHAPGKGWQVPRQASVSASAHRLATPRPLQTGLGQGVRRQPWRAAGIERVVATAWAIPEGPAGVVVGWGHAGSGGEVWR